MIFSDTQIINIIWYDLFLISWDFLFYFGRRMKKKKKQRFFVKSFEKKKKKKNPTKFEVQYCIGDEFGEWLTIERFFESC